MGKTRNLLYILSTVSLLAILSLYVFYQPLVVRVVAWQLKSFSAEVSKGHPLHWESVAYSNEAVVFTDVVLYDDDDAVTPGHLITAKTLSVRCAFDWRHLHLSLYIAADGLIWSLPQEIEHLPAISWSEKSLPFVEVSLLPTVDQASLIVRSKEGATTEATLTFSISSRAREHGTAWHIHCSQDPSSRIIAILPNSGAPVTDHIPALDIQHVDLQVANTFIQALYPTAPWSCLHGVLSVGGVAAAANEGGADFQGGMNVSELVLASRHNTLLSIGHLTSTFTVPLHEPNAMIVPWWQTLDIEADLIDIIASGGASGATWQLKEGAVTLSCAREKGGGLIATGIASVDQTEAGEDAREGQPWKMTSEWYSDAITPFAGSVDLSFFRQEQRQSAVHITAFAPTPQQYVLDIGLDHITTVPSRLLLAAAQEISPVPLIWKLDGGSYDADISLEFSAGECTEIGISQLIMQEAEWHNFSATTALSIDAEGDITFDPRRQDWWRSLDVALSIGRLTVKESDLFHRIPLPSPLAAFQGELLCRQGVLEVAHAQASFASLHSTIDLAAADMPRHFCLWGDGREIAIWFPESINSPLFAMLGHDKVSLALQVSPMSSGSLVAGVIAVEEEPTAVDEITFQATIVAPPNLPWLQTLLQASEESTLARGPERSPYQNLEVLGFSLKEGWCQAADLPLAKYLSPWLEAFSTSAIRGRASFEASLQEGHITVAYDAVELAIENPYFCIQIPYVAAYKGRFPSYSTSIGTPSHQGEAWVFGASYLEKNTGLLFEEIDARLVLDKDTLTLSEVTTLCEGVAFEGGLSVDWGKREQIAVAIRSPTIHSDTAAFERLIRHLSPELQWRVPLVGEVSSPDGGLSMDIIIPGGSVEIQASLKGRLDKATCPIAYIGGAIGDLSAEFAYEYPASALTISNASADLCFAGTTAPEVFRIYSPRIFFPSFVSDTVEFDLWAGPGRVAVPSDPPSADAKGAMDWHIAGKTHLVSGEGDERVVAIELDNDRSHLGKIQPHVDTLLLKGWTELLCLKAKALLDLASFHQAIGILSNIGWLPSNQALLGSVAGMEGDLDADISYDAIHRAFLFSVLGEKLYIKDERIDTFSLHGKWKEGLWQVDSLRIDDFALTSEFEYREDTWKVYFLGMRLSDAFLLGMNGAFDASQQVLHAQLTQLELDLDNLGNLARFHAFRDILAPHGKIRAEGDVDIDFSQGAGWTADATVDLSVRELEIKGVGVALANHIRCQYSSQEGLVTQGVSMRLTPKSQESAAIDVSLKEGSYQFATNKWLIDGLQFFAPISQMYTFFYALSAVTDHKQEIPLWVGEVKPDGLLSGQITARGTQEWIEARCEFADGEYVLLGAPRRIEHLSLEYISGRWLAQGQVRYQEEYYLVGIVPEDLSWQKGVVTIAQPVRRRDEVLNIHWQRDADDAISLSKISGVCRGVAATFHTDESNELDKLEASSLIGRVTVTLPDALPLIPAPMAERFKAFGIAGKCTLEGTLVLPKGDPAKWQFEGLATIPTLSLFSYDVHNVSSKVSWYAGHLYSRDISVQDRAGILYVPELSLQEIGNGQWFFQMPSLQLQGFRPSLLIKNGEPQKKEKRLVVTLADLHDVQGDIVHPETLTGWGQMQFVNPAASPLFGGLLVIPSDILSRLGFDLSVLSPVTGSINYTLRQGKVYLTSLDDVYSQGKRSRFYLPKGQYHSYLDFSGNLNILIRMKQYNLVFKMAELFTVNIQGTLERPRYSLVPLGSSIPSADPVRTFDCGDDEGY